MVPLDAFMVDPKDDSIELVPSQYERWREEFADERDRVHEVLASQNLAARLCRIEHVGSTAVPALAAKDIVDLDIIVEDAAVRRVSRALEAELGGDRYENSAGWQPVFRTHDGQRFNDHVFAVSDDGWKVSVVTRDVLRANPSLREEYEQLKRNLTTEYDDLVAYSKGKSEFIDRVLQTAVEDDDLTFEFTVPTES